MNIEKTEVPELFESNLTITEEYREAKDYVSMYDFRPDPDSPTFQEDFKQLVEMVLLSNQHK